MVPDQQFKRKCLGCGRLIDFNIGTTNVCPYCGYDYRPHLEPSTVVSHWSGELVVGTTSAVVGVIVGFVMIAVGVFVLGGDIIIAGATTGNIVEIGYFLAFSGTVLAIVSANGLALSAMRK